ncbi:MAG TPA: hypothetical protein VEK79_15360 [Thermoanaerobaculia bacterium]|nr:hypothetical protein [Thermoanaerobaculia bacterium]
MLDVDFERDMPLTADDIAALERARHHRPVPTAEYLKWLTLMYKPSADRRLNTPTDEPFEL